MAGMTCTQKCHNAIIEPSTFDSIEKNPTSLHLEALFFNTVRDRSLVMAGGDRVQKWGGIENILSVREWASKKY